MPREILDRQQPTTKSVALKTILQRTAVNALSNGLQVHKEGTTYKQTSPDRFHHNFSQIPLSDADQPTIHHEKRRNTIQQIVGEGSSHSIEHSCHQRRKTLPIQRANPNRQKLDELTSKETSGYGMRVNFVNQQLKTKGIPLRDETLEALTKNFEEYKNGTKSLSSAHFGEISPFFQASRAYWREGDYKNATMFTSGIILNLLGGIFSGPQSAIDYKTK